MRLANQNNLLMYLRVFLLVFCLALCIACIGSPVDSLHRTATSLYVNGYYTDAYLIFNKNLTIQEQQEHPDNEFLARTYRNIGMCLLELNQLKKAEKHLDQAVSRYQQIIEQNKGNSNDKNRNRLGVCYQHRARTMRRKGDFKRAADDAIQALSQFKLVNKVNNVARVNNILANIYIDTREYERAKILCETSIAEYESRDVDRNALADIYHTLAIANIKKTEYRQAIKAYKEALKFTGHPVDSAITYSSIGLTYLQIGDLVKSEKYLDKGLEIKQKANNNNPYHFSYAGIIENFGDLKVAQNKLDAALNYYQLALINLTDNFRDKNPNKNPEAENDHYIYNKIDLVRALHLKAKTAFKWYKKDKKKNKKYLTLAQDTYNTAFQFHNQLQQQIVTQESRLFQAEVIIPFIETALEVAYELQEIGEPSAETAFQFMEKSKATVLLQSINEAQALQYAGLPDSLLEQEKDLRIKITFYKKQVNDARQYEATDDIKQYEALLFEQQNIYDRLVRDLEKNHPEYYKLKYQQSNNSLEDVQKYLDKQTALLEYFVGDSSIYVLAIEKNTSRLYQLEKPENWTTTLSNFRRSITNKSERENGQLFTENAHLLYQCLLGKPLADLAADIKHLQIIPDGELNYIPFGLLLTKPAPDKIKYSDLAYLLHDKSVSYAYSAALLLDTEHQNRHQASVSYGGFAPVYLDAEHQDLPEGRRRVEQMAGNFKGEIFVGEEADKTKFIAQAARFNILDLSMHGVLDDENPLYSNLVFSEDKLYAADLYNIRLNASLAVLSACNTGTGKIKKGEGVMSLSRAFTYAGCPSLLMSLWSVPDGSTAIIMEKFFEELNKGKPKDEALKNAQLSYLAEASPDKKHPVYWAGFVPSGDMQPIGFSPASNYWWLILLGLSLLALVFYLKNNSKKL